MSWEGYGTTNQQWKSVLMAKYPIARAERTPKIWYFALHLRLGLVRHDTVWTIRIPYIISAPLHIILIQRRDRLWATQTAMYVSTCRTVSHFPCWEGTWNLTFYLKFESSVGQKWHSVDHKRIVYACRISYTYLHTPKEWYEILKQQCMHFLVA